MPGGRTPRPPKAPGPVSLPAPGALRRTLGVLRPHVAGSRLLVAGGLLAVLLEVAARLLEPIPVAWVIDGVIPAVTGQGVPGGTVELLVTAGVAVLGVAALRAGAAYVSTVAFALVGARVTTRLRSHLHDRLLGARLSFHEGARSGDLVNRMVGDVGRVQEVAVTAGLPLVANVVTVVAMVGVVLWLDLLLGAVVLVVLPLLLLSGRTAAGKITGASRSQRATEGQLAGDTGESFAAVRTVQAYGLVGHLGDRLRTADAKGVKDGVRTKRLTAGLERRTDLLVGLATALVLGIGGWRVVTGAITPGELVIVLTYLKTTFKPLRDLAKHTGRIAKACASGERIADALDRAEPEQDRSWARALPATTAGERGAVDVVGLVAGYPGREPVLRGADLRVRPGERVAVVGPSGAGKSTLLQVLLRFLDPADGVVRVDGHDVADLTRASLREATAVVLQDSVLMGGTLADNVRLGNLGVTDEEAEVALRRAGLGALVDSLPDGAASPVAERGATLSGGQRQRVAVARALVRDPALVLLDEPTTGLDATSAAEVLDALMELAEGRTTLLVTHDPALLSKVDRVVELRDGLLVEAPAPVGERPVGPGGGPVEGAGGPPDDAAGRTAAAPASRDAEPAGPGGRR
ncbi:ABC transporter ATP-binding protein [Pseudokineococcus sp. 1T1Z-3]|uniref:ABC transporter ATP-binding protein n=1 Tax=Pseudokineococcus sp. 1T1Z-3 TaxID=3132745 RepID=UPI003095B02B